MTFSPKRRASEFKYALQKAAANADFYGNVHPSELMVAEAVVAKARCQASLYYHSKGVCGAV